MRQWGTPCLLAKVKKTPGNGGDAVSWVEWVWSSRALHAGEDRGCMKLSLVPSSAGVPWGYPSAGRWATQCRSLPAPHRPDSGWNRLRNRNVLTLWLFLKFHEGLQPEDKKKALSSEPVASWQPVICLSFCSFFSVSFLSPSGKIISMLI